MLLLKFCFTQLVVIKLIYFFMNRDVCAQTGRPYVEEVIEVPWGKLPKRTGNNGEETYFFL